MNKQVIEDTTHYIRKELKRISTELLWADGAQEESLRARRERLQDELRRLTVLPLSNDSVAYMHSA